jgi:hypothetical protein
MYGIMVFYDPISDEILFLHCYLAGYYDVTNMPDRFKELISRPSQEWFDDFLIKNDCIQLGWL